MKNNSIENIISIARKGAIVGISGFLIGTIANSDKIKTIGKENFNQLNNYHLSSVEIPTTGHIIEINLNLSKINFNKKGNKIIGKGMIPYCIEKSERIGIYDNSDWCDLRLGTLIYKKDYF